MKQPFSGFFHDLFNNTGKSKNTGNTEDNFIDIYNFSKIYT
jgi:hypothetical protein